VQVDLGLQQPFEPRLAGLAQALGGALATRLRSSKGVGSAGGGSAAAPALGIVARRLAHGSSIAA